MDIAVQIGVFNEVYWVPIHTAARSIWVDMTWYVNHGRVVDKDYRSAIAADGSSLEIAGRGALEFRLWGTTFTEPVRVMATLPDTVLIGRDFWGRQAQVMNLETDFGSILVEGRRISGPVAQDELPLARRKFGKSSKIATWTTF